MSGLITITLSPTQAAAIRVDVEMQLRVLDANDVSDDLDNLRETKRQAYKTMLKEIRNGTEQD